LTLVPKLTHNFLSQARSPLRAARCHDSRGCTEPGGASETHVGQSVMMGNGRARPGHDKTRRLRKAPKTTKCTRTKYADRWQCRSGMLCIRRDPLYSFRVAARPVPVCPIVMISTPITIGRPRSSKRNLIQAVGGHTMNPSCPTSDQSQSSIALVLSILCAIPVQQPTDDTI
jgi:hypothetical protein